MTLPKDPAILLSYINTQLRDKYDSLDSFCDDNEADKNEIVEKLRTLGYEYSPQQNRFK